MNLISSVSSSFDMVTREKKNTCRFSKCFLRLSACAHYHTEKGPFYVFEEFDIHAINKMKNWIEFQRDCVYAFMSDSNDVIYYYLLLSILIVRSIFDVPKPRLRCDAFMDKGQNEWCTCVETRCYKQTLATDKINWTKTQQQQQQRHTLCLYYRYWVSAGRRVWRCTN